MSQNQALGPLFFAGSARLFSWEPASAVITWTDKNGSFGPVNRPTFYAVADQATVSSVFLNSTGITSISNMDRLPALAAFTTKSNPALKSLDATGCQALTSLKASSNSTLSQLIVDNCPLLALLAFNATQVASVEIGRCPLLLSLSGSGCPLSVLQVNAFLAQLAAFGLSGGAVLLNLLSPHTPPSVGPPDGIAAKATLISRSWTVTTD